MYTCWYQILHKIKLLFHIPLLKYPNKWNMTSNWRTVSKLVFVKIENNLLCVVLIKTIVFDMHYISFFVKMCTRNTEIFQIS